MAPSDTSSSSSAFLAKLAATVSYLESVSLFELTGMRRINVTDKLFRDKILKDMQQ